MTEPQPVILSTDDVKAAPRPYSGEPDAALLERWPSEPMLAVFFIGLTTPIGFPHASTWMMERPETVEWLKGTAHSPAEGMSYVFSERGANYVSLKVWQAKQPVILRTPTMEATLRVVKAVLGTPEREAAQNEPPSGLDTFTTVMEAVTPLIAGRDQVFHAALSDSFDRVVDEINTLVRAHMITTGDAYARFVTRWSIHPIVPYTVRQPFSAAWFGLGMFYPSDFPRVFHNPQIYDEDTLNRFSVVLSRQRQVDPFGSFLEWSRTARHAYTVDGDNALAVIAAHTAGEVLFDAVLLMMAWEEGLTASSAQAWFEDGLAKRLRTHYSSRLGGNWDTTVESTTAGRWVIHVSHIRNRAVHAGYRPSDVETQRAIDALYEIELFLKDRLVQVRTKYPRTTLLLLGKPGLEKRGMYRGKIKRFAEVESVSEPGWLSTYQSWIGSA